MKMSMKIALLSVFAILTFNQTARAGLLLEPYLGYAFSGDIKGASSYKITGTELGARVGFSTLGFAIGGEYMSGNFKDDAPNSSTYTNNDLGIFASFKFPILVRVYATFFPSSEFKQSATGYSATIKSGTQTKLGVGFTGFPIISVNLEYLMGSYSKVNFGGGDVDLNPAVKTNAMALVVSAPFDLL
ncbi:MAG: hypothetical protein H7328_03630 [Bdellovibrio sp.]|nr:hypothetical protein [Bdellovibrio sp.]